jgi:branched-chain amino acid transport system substrate-binding protein
MKLNTKIVLAVLVCAVVAASVVAYRYRIHQPAASPFTVSVNIPLTGPIANSGKLFQDAVSLAIDDTWPGAGTSPLRFDWNDNRGIPAVAATIAQRQASSKASMFYVGYSTETIASEPTLAATGKPTFTFSFLASITQSPLIFRNSLNYKIELPLLISYVKERKAKRVAVIHLDLPEAQELFSQMMIPELVKSGWQRDSIALFPYAVTESDFRTIAAKVASSSADLIILNGFQSTLAPLVQSLQAANLVQDGNVFATFDMIDVPRLIGAEAVEGIRVATPTYLTRPSAKTSQFVERYRSRFQRMPTYSDYTGYDTVLIANDLLKRLPAAFTPEQLIKAIAATSIEGVSGHIKFDADGDASPAVEIAVFRNGKLVPMERP